MLALVAKAAVIAAIVFVVALVGLAIWQRSLPSPQESQQQHVTQEGEADEKKTKHDNDGVFDSFIAGVVGFVRLLDSHNGLVNAIGTLIVALFTGVLFIATVALFISSEKVADSAKKSADAALKQTIVMDGQLQEIKRQSVAAERASTTGRAYLFAKYETPQGFQITPVVSGIPEGPPKNENFMVAVVYSIKNFGQTPAIITALDTHVLMSKDGGMINNPPDPQSDQARELFETLRGPTIRVNPSGDSGIFLIENDSRATDPIRITIPAGGETGPLRQTFKFRDRIRPSGNSAHGGWFYCAITYNDIFGTERHTFFYVGMVGAGIRYPANSAYNRWD
jgi:hypothetical protein